MDIEMMEGMAECMAERGIKEEDLRMTIEDAEKKKTFVMDGSTIIGKTKLGNMTVYAVYEKKGSVFMVKTAYSHMVHLTSEKE